MRFFATDAICDKIPYSHMPGRLMVGHQTLDLVILGSNPSPAAVMTMKIESRNVKIPMCLAISHPVCVILQNFKKQPIFTTS